METVDVIRPESALADWDLRVAWDDHVRELKVGAAAGDRKQRKRLSFAADIRSILAAYPWQRLNYRYGRWEADLTFWKALVSFEAWESYHWVSDDRSFQVLDPYSGRRLGEMYRRKNLLAMPGGALEFAGDPTTVGVYRPIGGGVHTVSIGWCWFLGLAPFRAGIDALRAGADRLPPLHKHVDLDLHDRYRAWFIDEPDKPRRKAPFAREARLYRATNVVPMLYRPRSDREREAGDA